MVTAEQNKIVVTHLMEKINGNADDIVRLEEDQVEGADVVVVSYGITSRIAVKAIQDARKEGIKVGSLRLITDLAVLREAHPRTGRQGQDLRRARDQLRPDGPRGRALRRRQEQGHQRQSLRRRGA